MLAWMLLSCAVPQYTPELEAVWLFPPDIEICSRLQIKTAKLIRHLDWWGKEISDVYQYGEVFFSDCQEPVDDYVIRFDLANPEYLWEYDYVAYTISRDDPFSYYPYIRLASEVFLVPHNGKWTIRHEIGHAWGWYHTPDEQEEHLMSPWAGRVLDGLDQYSREGAWDYE